MGIIWWPPNQNILTRQNQAQKIVSVLAFQWCKSFGMVIFFFMAKNGFVLRNWVKGAILGDNNFSLKFVDAFIMSGCSGMLRSSAFTWYWQKTTNYFSFGGKRALCFKKVCIVKFSQKGTIFFKWPFLSQIHDDNGFLTTYIIVLPLWQV